MRRFRGLAVHPLQPRFLPEDETAGLTSIMRRTIATQIVEEHSTLQTIQSGTCDGVTDFMRSTDHPELPTAKPRHERHRSELASIVKRLENFVGASYFDEFASSKIQIKLSNSPGHKR